MIGLLSCSSLKLMVPAPAKWLYSRSPRFAQQFMFLKEKCSEVFIVSAQHGILREDQVVFPYDRKLSEMDARSRVALARWINEEQLINLRHETFLSLLPKLYRTKLLSPQLKVVDATTGGMMDTAKAIGKQPPIDPKDWPIQWVLEAVGKPGGILRGELQRQLEARAYHPTTVKCQLQRAESCPLHTVSGDLIFNKYQANKI